MFIGLSLLAKGLIGLVIPFGVVGLYQLVRRQFPARSFLLTFWWGLPLTLAVASTWYVPVILKHGWPFIDEFFIQHHFARYLSNKYRHPQPFYFYLLILIPLSLPWTAFLIEGLVKARSWRLRSTDSVDRLRVFALAWLLMPLAFFSFSGSKLPGYILPVLPAGALIAGERLTKFLSGDRDGFWAMRITGALFGLFAIVGSVYVSSLRQSFSQVRSDDWRAFDHHGRHLYFLDEAQNRLGPVRNLRHVRSAHCGPELRSSQLCHAGINARLDSAGERSWLRLSTCLRSTPNRPLGRILRRGSRSLRSRR